MHTTRRDLVVFEHIPKTAGSTTHLILWQVYGGKKVFMSATPGLHRGLVAKLCHELEDPNNPYRAIISHVGTDFHERFPPGYRYRPFTFLRDPVKRVISHYHYQIHTNQLDPSVPLETFVQDDLTRSYNVQTAFLGGLECRRNLESLILTPDLYTEAVFEKAKARLRQMEAFGFTEQFDESLYIFRKVFGWPWIRTLYARQRVGQRYDKAKPVSEKTLELIRSYNVLDQQLYDYAQDLYQQQVHTLFPEGIPGVSTFQKVNTLYGKVYPHIPSSARTIVRHVRALVDRNK